MVTTLACKLNWTDLFLLLSSQLQNNTGYVVYNTGDELLASSVKTCVLKSKGTETDMQISQMKHKRDDGKVYATFDANLDAFNGADPYIEFEIRCLDKTIKAFKIIEHCKFCLFIKPRDNSQKRRWKKQTYVCLQLYSFESSENGRHWFERGWNVPTKQCVTLNQKVHTLFSVL